MTSSTRVAVLRIPIAAVRERYELEPASEGWSTFVGADATRLEIRPRGDVSLVRFAGSLGQLSACFGELWRLHEEPRGVAVHEQLPNGDDYAGLIAGASWEGGWVDAVAEQLLSAVAKRSSRKVLAARLAVETGEKDLGDVVDAMASDDREGEEVLVAQVAGRFGYAPKQQALADLLARTLTTDDEEQAGDE